ncbi:MAG: hypothetical protein Q4F24_06855 [Eubacteriales bacterium]|nr:hypothetical protein [Eubacteriales bacterium]
MLDTLKETFPFIVESFQTYSGSNRIWLLFPAALIIILFLGKTEDRKLFVMTLGIEILTIFNPVFAHILIKIFSFENRYLRFFWMVLFFLTIAYAMVLLIFHFKKLSFRIFSGIVCTALILTLGSPVFIGADAPPYRQTENDAFTSDKIIELSALLHSEGYERPRVLYGGLMLVYRQYDPSVISITSRSKYRYLQSHTYEEFMENTHFPADSQLLYRVYYYEDFSVNPEDFVKSLNYFRIDYVVSSTDSLDRYLETTSLVKLGETASYRVWKTVK